MCSRRLSSRGPERGLRWLAVVFLSTAVAVGLTTGWVALAPGPAYAQSSASEVEASSGEASSDEAERDELRRSGDGREEDSTGIRIGAGLASLLYTPTKVAYAGLGVVVGGLGWIFSGGEGQVALDIMQPSFRGDYLIRPAHLRGTESIRFVGRKPASEQAVALQQEPRPKEEPQASASSGESAEPSPSPSPSGDLAGELAGENAVGENEKSGPVVGDASTFAAGAVAPARPSAAGTGGDAGARSGSREVADPRSSGSSGEQIRSILSNRDGSNQEEGEEREEVDSATRGSGSSTPGLPAVSSPPPSRSVDETGEARGAEDARPATSGRPPVDRTSPPVAEVGRARWEERRKEVPNRAREESPREPAAAESAESAESRESGESAWPEPQADSMQWKKNARGVWVYEAP